MFNMVKPKECQVDVVHIKVATVWYSGYHLVRPKLDSSRNTAVPLRSNLVDRVDLAFLGLYPIHFFFIVYENQFW
jgi:hypothetical protein